jgi:hypothetical protein
MLTATLIFLTVHGLVLCKVLLIFAPSEVVVDLLTKACLHGPAGVRYGGGASLPGRL